MKNSTRNKFNLVFSGFLVTAYIVCTFFFSTLASQVAAPYGSLIQVAVLLLFGLLLFYATRVGEGKQVKRFSLVILLLVDLPCLYAILASFFEFLPLHDYLASVSVVAGTGAANSQPIVMLLASVALGYAIPYTFLSGYELKVDEDETVEEEETVIEGGLAEELADAEAKEEEIAAAEEEADVEVVIQEIEE